MKILRGTRLAKPVLLATCEGDMKLFKTVEAAQDGTVTVVRYGHTVTYPGPIGYIERDGKISSEEPVLTITAMMPYWDFVEDADEPLK